MKEAQRLNIQRQCGGGPKWRSLLVYSAIIVVTIGLLVVRFVTEVAPRQRVWFIATCIVIFFVILFFKRKTRQKRDEPARIEISDQELILSGRNGRTVMPWSGFSQCLESPALFVLLDKPRRLLFAIPKRAFPDEKSQDWFRTLVKQLENPIASPAGESFMPGRIAGKGVALTVQLGFRDYLARMLTSWRIRGIVLGLMVLFAGFCLFNPQPVNPEIPRGRMLLIMLVSAVPIFAVAFFLALLVTWRSEKKSLQPKHLVVGSEGIQFAGRDGSGLLAWTTYKYYLENRWAFFVWNPQGSLWLMLPKRLFASPMEVEECRDLLHTNLTASRWFYF